MKTIISVLCCVLMCAPLMGQDLIVKMNDEEIIAKVVEIRKNKVEYYAFDSQEGEPVSLDKSDIYMIIYEGGMRQFFSDPRDPRDILGEDFSEDQMETLYLKGIEDADLYFDRKGLIWVSMGATIFMPVVGIFSGGLLVGAIALTETNISLDEVPNPELYRNPYYAEGFQKKSHKIKMKRMLSGFGLGVAIQAIVIVIMIAA